MKYLIPIRLHRPKARSKAEIAYVQQWNGGNLYKMLPAIGARIVAIEARSHAEAYRQLCAILLPNDPRPIMGKWAIKHFLQQEETQP